MRQGGVPRGPFGPVVSGRGFDRNGAGQRKSGNKTGWHRPRRRGWLMIHRGGTAKFVPSHVGRDVFIERRELAVAPVFVEDIELQDAILDLEIVQCRHGVGVVASSADHSTQLVANLANDEVLLGRTYAK